MEIDGKPDGLSAVILAAGMSRRMGQPKMLLPLANGTLLQQIVQTYLQILPASQIVVVTGHQPELIEDSLAGMGVRFAFNADYEVGMLSSVKTGISCTSGWHSCFVALGDQPFVQAKTLRSMVQSHGKAGALISQPSYRGKVGHPLLIASRGFDEILSLPETATLKTFVNDHPVNAVEVDDAFVLNDVDTPSDYQRLLQIRSETCSLVETS